MNDAKGRELKVGDTVLIPCRVTGLGGTAEFPEVNMETLGGRVDGSMLGFCPDPRQVYRANPGDDTTIVIQEVKPEPVAVVEGEEAKPQEPSKFFLA